MVVAVYSSDFGVSGDVGCGGSSVFEKGELDGGFFFGEAEFY